VTETTGTAWIISAIISSVISAAISSAVVSAVVAAIFKRSENRQMHALSTEIELLRSEQRQAENRAKTQFDWIHQRKAEAAVEVYALLVEVDVATSELSHILARSTEAPTAYEEAITCAAAATSRAADEFSKTYTRKALLLPEAVVTALEEVAALLWRKSFQALDLPFKKTEQDRALFEKQNDWTEIRERVRDLRASLRTILGEVEKDAVASLI
jgi:hypothetical protein